MQVLALPRDPYIGMWHEENFDIDFSDLDKYLGWGGVGLGLAWIVANCTKREVAKTLVATYGFGLLSAALGVAGVIFGELALIYERMKVKIKYLFIYNNDGLLDWNVGPITYNVY